MSKRIFPVPNDTAQASETFQEILLHLQNSEFLPGFLHTPAQAILRRAIFRKSNLLGNRTI